MQPGAKARTNISLLNKHQLKTEATKHKLVAAALRVFSRDGFEAARIDDIAREAGYTRGAFYAHFRTKEDLFFSLLEEESLKHRERIRRTLESCSLEHDRIRALRDYYAMRVADRRWSILVLEFKLYAIRHPRLRAKLAEMHRSIRTRMKLEGLERLLPGILRTSPEARELKKVVLEVILNGLVIEQAYDPANISQIQVEVVLRQLFDALAPLPLLGNEEISASEEELAPSKRSRNSHRGRVSAYGTAPKPL
ncbi:MAG: TetR/AcrR family transcriptional regulator [Acidobacteriota bacterium]|nr:TetR/AcrR family transcriptional regulator [Acidobacteriota bacterium]